MKKDDTTGTVLGCLLLLLSLPFSALWSGYVLSILWGWFIVPTFETRPLGVLPAIGVSMIVDYLTMKNDTYIDKDKSAGQRYSESFGYMVLRPTIALAFGWVLHSFM